MTVCKAVYFPLGIDQKHILPPVTAEGFGGSHHPRFAECVCGPVQDETLGLVHDALEFQL